MTLGKSFHPDALEMSRKGKKIPWKKNISPWQKEALEEAQSLMPGEGCKVWGLGTHQPQALVPVLSAGQLELQEFPSSPFRVRGYKRKRTTQNSGRCGSDNSSSRTESALQQQLQ